MNNNENFFISTLSLMDREKKEPTKESGKKNSIKWGNLLVRFVSVSFHLCKIARFFLAACDLCLPINI